MKQNTNLNIHNILKNSPLLLCIVIAALPVLLLERPLFALENAVSITAAVPVKRISLLESVRETIKNHPNIHLDEHFVKASEGQLQIESGKFDVTLRSQVAHGRQSSPLSSSQKEALGTSKTTEQTTEYSLGLNKELRSGIELSPNIKMTNTNDLVTGAETTNFGTVEFSIKIPLLRERGKTANAADEISANYVYESSKYNLRHTISNSILNVVEAYWETAAAIRNFNIAEGTEKRAQTMYESAKVLVEAGEQPASELNQLSANMAGKTANRISRTQSLFEARQKLGLAMGLTFDKITASPLTSDLMPAAGSVTAGGVLNDQALIDISLSERSDLAALKKREQAAKVLARGAKSNLKPQFDLNIDLGYSGLNEGNDFDQYFSAFNENEAGLNAKAMFSYEWPIKNDFRKGTFRLQNALRDQAVIRTNDLTRNIVSRVSVAISNVRNSLAELQKAHESVLYYKTAVDKEKMKLKLGMGTVIDLIDVDDRLTSALLNEVFANLKYANAIIRLRFETGTIISSNMDDVSVSIGSLIEPPDPRLAP